MGRSDQPGVHPGDLGRLAAPLLYGVCGDRAGNSAAEPQLDGQNRRATAGTAVRGHGTQPAQQHLAAIHGNRPYKWLGGEHGVRLEWLADDVRLCGMDDAARAEDGYTTTFRRSGDGNDQRTTIPHGLCSLRQRLGKDTRPLQKKIWGDEQVLSTVRGADAQEKSTGKNGGRGWEQGDHRGNQGGAGAVVSGGGGVRLE